VACSKCYEYIKQFQRFRSALREKQSRKVEIVKSQSKRNKQLTPATITEPSPNTFDFDPTIKIKEEPKDDYELESVIDIQHEAFGDHQLEIKEELIDEDEHVVIKEEPMDDLLVSEIKTEPEQFQQVQQQQQHKPQLIIKRIVPSQSQKILIKKPHGGIIVKPVSLKNLKVVQPTPTQKFQIIKHTPVPQFQQITNSNGTIKITTSQLSQMAGTMMGFKCQYCPNRFIERRFVAEHIRQKHAFKCGMCPSIFPFKITLIKHQMSLHGAAGSLTVVNKGSSGFKFVCTVCVCRFSTQANLDIHMAQKHASVKREKSDENVAVVVQSPQPSTSSVIRHHPVNTLVRKILKPANITPHAADTVVEDADGIPCLDCGLLLRPDKLLKHRMDAHSLNTHNLHYMCDICGAEIKGKTQLINHMTNRHLAKYFAKCEFCDGLFANQTEVICHKNLQHNFNGTRYTCHFCNKIYANKRDMILHRKQHYSEKDSRERLARIFCKKFKSYEPKSEEY
jgi:hypothetical protein